MPKRRMTPFARFFIVMLIVVPLAYFGASWYNGDDPLGLRERVGLEKPSSTPTTVKADDESASVESLELRIDQLEEQLKQCRQELQELKTQNATQQ